MMKERILTSLLVVIFISLIIPYRLAFAKPDRVFLADKIIRVILGFYI